MTGVWENASSSSRTPERSGGTHSCCATARRAPTGRPRPEERSTALSPDNGCVRFRPWSPEPATGSASFRLLSPWTSTRTPPSLSSCVSTALRAGRASRDERQRIRATSRRRKSSPSARRTRPWPSPPARSRPPAASRRLSAESRSRSIGTPRSKRSAPMDRRETNVPSFPCSGSPPPATTPGSRPSWGSGDPFPAFGAPDRSWNDSLTLTEPQCHRVPEGIGVVDRKSLESRLLSLEAVRGAPPVTLEVDRKIAPRIGLRLDTLDRRLLLRAARRDLEDDPDVRQCRAVRPDRPAGDSNCPRRSLAHEEDPRGDDDEPRRGQGETCRPGHGPSLLHSAEKIGAAAGVVHE